MEYTDPRMADSTLTEVMDGVQQLAAMEISGCRLILARHFEFVVLLHRATKTVQDGPQRSHCPSLMIVAYGHITRMEIVQTW